MKKRIFMFATLITILFCLFGCDKKSNYYDDSIKEAKKIAKIEGNETLSLQEENEQIILENQNIRLILGKNSGAIKEYANKEVGVYFVTDPDGYWIEIVHAR